MSKIANEYRDTDGYWIELKRGWRTLDEYALHGIVADTRAEARARARQAVPCDCAGCNNQANTANEERNDHET